jgi:glutathione synthase/RimK-type ligase-like ATP-grasp enzyme
MHMPEEAPLYTQYVPKRHEYRVHVFQGRVIDVQRKARRHDVADEDVNWKVRNNANGFIFARNGDALGTVPDDVLYEATKAVTSLNLDFGAADVIFNEREALAYVLEVNTAPGLVGTTLENYTAAFEAYRGE